MPGFACVSSLLLAADCGWLRKTCPAGSEVQSIQWLLSFSALWAFKKVWAVTSYSLPYVVLQGHKCYLQNYSRHAGIVTRLLAAMLRVLNFDDKMLRRAVCKLKTQCAHISYTESTWCISDMFSQTTDHFFKSKYIRLSFRLRKLIL